MLGDDELVRLRGLATGLAYRMLGSLHEAEDLAQEALVRVVKVSEEEELRSPDAFVTTVATRLCLDHLRSARHRRERYVGPWLPEPVTEDPVSDPERTAELADSLSYGFLVLLEALGPPERAALLLHDVFGYSYGELARLLGRNEASCRQLVTRARHRIAGASPRRSADEHLHRELLHSFLVAARRGDVDALESLLVEHAVLVTDGGPGRRAARHPVVGRARVVRLLRRVAPPNLHAGVVVVLELNGEPAFVVRSTHGTVLAGFVAVEQDRIARIHWVLNRHKLERLDR